MNPGERRQEVRREEDEALLVRLGYVERALEVFAPTTTIVAVHTHQLEEGEKRMDALERELRAVRKEAQDAASDLLKTINAVKVEVKGISVRLALIVGLASLLGGAIVTAVISILTNH